MKTILTFTRLSIPHLRFELNNSHSNLIKKQIRTSITHEPSIRSLSSSSTSSPPPPSPKNPPPPQKRALVDLALIASGVIAVGTTLLWLKSSQRKQKQFGSDSFTVHNRDQFEIPIASYTGSPAAKKTLTMLSQEETDKLLRKYEATFAVDRSGNPVYRYDTNHVASNSPIEDDSLCTIMARDQSQLPPDLKSALTGDMLFFGVFDGHSGWQTSKLLVNRLVPSVGRELQAIFRSEPEYVATYLAKELAATQSAATTTKLDKLEIPNSLMEKIWSILSMSTKPSRFMIKNLDEDEEIVQTAIKNAFVRLDEEIVNRPVRMLEEVERRTGKSSTGPLAHELTPQQTESLQALLPALSGSCALLAYIDTARSKVHVACTGDSRAVMGVWDAKANNGKGQWRAELLSEDQEGLNPKEVERIRSEHPPAERENVVRRGRILGGLQPTRAFGDARYKWPIGIQEKLYATFHPTTRARRDPPDYLTPPYVTARPEVTSTKIPTESQTTKPAFIVLATDGLWDRLETAEVVGLVGSWIDIGSQSSTSSTQILSKEVVAGPEQVKVIKPLDSVSAHEPNESENGNEQKQFVFEDGNVATHLIRNALGGPSREKVSALLSIPAPHSRRYRDDITVTVVFLDPYKTGKQQESTKGGGEGDGVTKIKPDSIGLSKL
ncbi:hypothetical protein CROQUDRAFT_90296 [Cronartium quercuum f. sp. fusiforme G11]|uniref:PPM-type phosphatase domain-containing protein n=1 Tax=Cronartium quercuum f. sp. fusiforme G11 TaxID=708437 RepID=A0A9P6NJW2_9BASI|nr:hypothetical protein CROQUDRAFT_41415 [Cronartium quercuum f. sp. fusiforme G11]KAG0148384.1 hypothetical protein CROQUDRAFT_90296 [Cronartium quercuum f. sp. fusiforme G11]